MDSPLIQALQNPSLFEHPVTRFRVFETHISWILLTGPFAYKIKKPLCFGFLDFSTLERRHFCCEEEIRLNSRLAPLIYHSVIAIYGTEDNPNLAGKGSVIEYAVKMIEFNQEDLLDNLLVKGLYTAALNFGLADTIAQFHSTIEKAPSESPFGTAEYVKKPVTDNYKIIEPLLTDRKAIRHLHAHKEWADQEYEQLKPLFGRRKVKGHIRECHGDIHLGNIAKVGDALCVFDCIEFNPNYRWIDSISDAAFLFMDLKSRGQEGHASLFINRYLERTGDYESIALLKYYTSYRAMVRAKISMLRRGQGSEEKERKQLYKNYQKYFTLATVLVRPSHPFLIMMYGVSGSGKSLLAEGLIEHLSAIRLRSDVERKRLFGIAAEANSRGVAGKNLYTPSVHRKTFQRLRTLAECILKAGFSVILDATFLKQGDRYPFEELAKASQVPWVIMRCEASQEVCEGRIKSRMERLQDPSEATITVLHAQLKTKEPFTEEEKKHVLYCGTEAGILDIQAIAEEIKQRVILR
ncbi:MAG: AAA family ATPase [Gammaproteobacteria bacterium]|nr:AAA family ATPase [Gammaproteobacteria bacterium]